MRVYLEEHQVTVNEGCIAIACPITGDWVAMTNHTWAFSIAEMKRNLGFAHLEIINDFTAVSMAIPMLKAEHLIQFGVGSACRAKAVMLILPRTAKKKGSFWKSYAPSWGMFPQNACSQVPGWSTCIARLSNRTADCRRTCSRVR